VRGWTALQAKYDPDDDIDAKLAPLAAAPSISTDDFISDSKPVRSEALRLVLSATGLLPEQPSAAALSVALATLETSTKVEAKAMKEVGAKASAITQADVPLIGETVTTALADLQAVTVEDGGKKIVLAAATTAEVAKAEVAKKAVEASINGAANKVARELYARAAEQAGREFVKFIADL